jgi:hypothetical protein
VLKTVRGGRLGAPDNHRAEARNPRLGGDLKIVWTRVCKKCSPAVRSIKRASNPAWRCKRGKKGVSPGTPREVILPKEMLHVVVERKSLLAGSVLFLT